MTRREFIAAVSAAGLAPSRASASTPFPVHYAKPNPYNAALQFIDPGSDEFTGEKDAVELEARLERIFAGREAAPPGLERVDARAAAKFAARDFMLLPDERVRYEIKTETEYHTGVWQLPDFKAVTGQVGDCGEAVFSRCDGACVWRRWIRSASNSFREIRTGGRASIRRAASTCTGTRESRVADIDNDGVDEIYVCQPGGLPNRLYKIRARRNRRRYHRTLGARRAG